jgi:hypothetical protein
MHKSDFQEKSWKILQNSYFTRRHTEPEYETEGAMRDSHPLVARGRPGHARGGEAASAIASTPPSAYIYILT